jgi:hypothetical protein
MTFSYLLKNTFLCFPHHWWLNLITHTLFCPIVCELRAPYDQLCRVQLAWAHGLLWIVWTLILSLNYSQKPACSHPLPVHFFMFVGGYGGIIHTTCWMWYILVEAQIGGVSRDVELHGVMEFRRSSEGMCHSQCLRACIFTACSIQTLSLLCCRSQDSVVHRNGHNN